MAADFATMKFLEQMAEAGGKPLEIHADNDAIVLQLQQEVDPHRLLSLVTPQNLAGLLRSSLEQSGFFGARFRECAGRSLLLTKQKFNQRLPLWMSRLQAKKLMSTVRDYPDFPRPGILFRDVSTAARTSLTKLGCPFPAISAP